MTVKLLVTTGLIETWGKEEELIFLGQWCKEYTQKPLWDKRISRTVDYHWRDRDKLAKDHDYLENLYEKVLVKLSSRLNLFHRVNNSNEYWRIIIGPWLLTYIPVLWDRWEMLSSIQEISHELRTKIVNQKLSRQAPNDYIDAIRLFDSDLWNHQIMAEMIMFRKDFNIEVEEITIDFTRKKSDFTRKKSNNLIKRPFEQLKKSTKDLLRGLIRGLEYFIPMGDTVLIQSYFPFIFLLKLHLKLGLIPRWHGKLKQSLTYPKKSERSNFSEFKDFFLSDPNERNFLTFVSKNILQDIPICHLEGFNTIHKIQSTIYHSKNIFTANSHFSNEIFKVWAAEQKLCGSKLVISSHGGALYPLFSVFNHQEKISDKRIIWGKKWMKDQIRLPANKLDQKIYSSRSSGMISLIDYDNPKYSYRCAAIPMGPLSLEQCDLNISFIKNLSPHIRNKIQIRPKPSGGWEKQQRYIDEFGFDIISTQPSVKSTILNSRLVICTYPQTTFSEAMVSGVPTMILYLEKFWEVQPIYDELMVLLKKSGIMHTTASSATTHIEKIFDNPMNWWNEEKTKKARKKFADLCLTIDQNPLNLWVSFFKESLTKK